jgi:Ca-activated chloride channel family protein
MKTKFAFTLACLIILCTSGYLVINFMKSNRAHCSFVEGTEVLTKQGLRAIEQIVTGDEVYAYDIKSEGWSYKPVIETVSHEYSGNLVTVKTENETIRVTVDHPFLVLNNQRADYRPYIKTKQGKYWVSAEHLKPGDALLLRDDTQSIVSNIRIHSDSIRVYSLNVKSDHNYTVGDEGIVVSDVTVTVRNVAYGYGGYGGGGGGGCFPAGTQVLTEKGFKPIESIQEGTGVYAHNIKTGQWVMKEVVVNIAHQYEGDTVTIETGGTEIESTGNHPFWVVKGKDLGKRPFAADVPLGDRRLTGKGRWVEARHLRPGDVLRGLNSEELTVISLSFSRKQAPVYNLSVEDSHTDTVGQEGILVHNKGKAEKSVEAYEEAEIVEEPLTEQALIVPQQEWNTEEYDRIYEQPFLKALDNPLSTFSIDVDTASYSNVRRFLQGGKMPYKDAVRIEEFINYFSYDYPEPVDELPFSFNVEVSDCPWNQEHMLIHIGLQGKKISYENLPPNNLVFLIDVSGSMNSSEKLPLLKEAVTLLIEEMRDIDSIAMVVYAGAAGLVLPPTPCSEKQKIMGVLERLQAGGSTAGGAGIKRAYDVAREHYDPNGNNRVILATDGDFNVGVSSNSELVRLIEEKREDGIYLTVLGFGMGNYKDSKMESLADSGNGNYAYIDSLREAKKVLVSELGGTLFTIAKDVKMQIEFNPVVVDSYRLIGYENRMLRKEDFVDDTKDAGDLGAGHTVTALYEIVLTDEGDESTSELRYQTADIKDAAYASNEVMLIKFRYKRPEEDISNLIEKPVPFNPVVFDASSNDFRISAAVAAFGLILKDSNYKGGADYDLVLRLAEQSIGPDREWYRKEFIGLVKTAQWIDER